ncbi:hypothetical protein TD95_005210, partial [Thielaviopsis punctulata]
SDTGPPSIMATHTSINSAEPAQYSSDDIEKIAGVRHDTTDDEIAAVSDKAPAHVAAQDADGGSVLGKVLTKVFSRATFQDPGPPPDGGLKAWLAVLGGHLIIMNTWGVIVSFGIFQTYYTSILDKPRSTISWIGSLQVFLLFFVGTFTGRIADAGYYRHLIVAGTAFQMVGVFTASAATQYWQLLLSQGICFGLGNGCLFCPTVATVSTYFSTHRVLAIGIAACGTATGGLVFPGIARTMLPHNGFAWTMRTMGFVQLATLCMAFFLVKPRIPPRKSAQIVEWAAFKELDYTFYAVGNFFCFLGLYFAFFYLSSFARQNITPVLSYENSLNLIMILNGVGIIGRIIPNYITESAGLLNTYIPVTFVTGALMLFWMAVTTDKGVYGWSIFYGIFAGGIQSLFPAGLSTLTTDLSKQGTRMGMTFTIVSFAVLAGPPIEGALIQALHGKYYGAQGFAGGCTIVGGCFITAARMCKARRVQKPGESIWKVKA